MTEENIVRFRSAANADDVIEQAVGQYESVLILGYDRDGEMDVRSTGDMDKRTATFLLQQFLHNLMDGRYDVD